MRIEIHVSQFDLTDSLRAHIERRAQFAFSWAHSKLQKVSVRLSDVNGPKGGPDKSCRIQIPLAGGSDVVIEDVKADLYVAIDRAIERASRVLSRRVKHLREHSRQRLVPVDAFESKAVV